MISFEQWGSGFVVTVEGQRVVWHSVSAPALFVGMPKNEVESGGNHRGGGQTAIKWRGLGPCTVINEGPESTVLRFGDECTLKFSYAARVLRVRFLAEKPERKSLKIVLGANPGEKLFGLGPSLRYDMKTKSEIADCREGGGHSGRVPAVFSSRGGWMFVRGAGRLSWQFDPCSTILRTDGIPAELAIGFGEDPARGLESLSRYRAAKRTPRAAPAGKNRAKLPEWAHEGIVLKCDEAPPGSQAQLEPFSASGIKIACLVRSDGQGGTGQEGTQTRTLSPREWDDAMAGASPRPLLPEGGTPKNATELVRTLLSLSFSGEGFAYIPIRLPSPERNETTGSGNIPFFLDIAMFSSLFVVELSAEGYPARPVLHHMARTAAIYAALKAYHDHCSTQWVQKGIPALSHPAVYYPEEKALWELDDQYMYGPDVVVAPSLSGSPEARRLYLPDDEWIHVWTSRHYPKGTVVVDAPAGKPAVFYRQKSEFAGLFDVVRQMATRL